jgi:hypothetical protein
VGFCGCPPWRFPQQNARSGHQVLLGVQNAASSDVSDAPSSSASNLKLALRVFKEQMDERADIERNL